MLSKIKSDARLSYGQLAQRTNRSRSGLHKAAAPASTLPARDLALDFVKACGISSMLVEAIMDVWEKVHLSELTAAASRESGVGKAKAHQLEQEEGQAESEQPTIQFPPTDHAAQQALVTLEKYGTDRLIADLRRVAEALPSGSDIYIQIAQGPGPTNTNERLLEVASQLVHDMPRNWRSTVRTLVVLFMPGALVTCGFVTVMILVVHFPLAVMIGTFAAMAVSVGILLERRFSRARRDTPDRTKGGEDRAREVEEQKGTI